MAAGTILIFFVKKRHLFLNLNLCSKVALSESLLMEVDVVVQKAVMGFRKGLPTVDAVKTHSISIHVSSVQCAMWSVFQMKKLHN